MSVSAVGVRLSSQQLGDKLGHGLTAATTSVVVVKFAAPKTSGTAAYGSDGGTEARLWGDATALNCCGWVGGRGEGGEERERQDAGGGEVARTEEKKLSSNRGVLYVRLRALHFLRLFEDF